METAYYAQAVSERPVMQTANPAEIRSDACNPRASARQRDFDSGTSRTRTTTQPRNGSAACRNAANPCFVVRLVFYPRWAKERP